MYTNDDYFKHESYGYGYSESQADWQAQVDIDEISDRFNHFLKWQGCEQTRYSDWYYSCQCHGLDAGPTGYSDWWNLRPTKIEPSDMQWWCDYDFMRCWQRHYYRLCWIADAMERYECERDNLEYTDDFESIDDDAFNYLYNLYDRLYTTFLDMYEEAYSDAIEELCHTAQKLMEDVCDYAYSDEAAEEWCEFKNSELEYQEEQERIRKAKEADERRERDFENMAGMTATSDSYTA